MIYYITTASGRHGPLDEEHAIELCLSGAVSPNARIEEAIRGGTREMELFRFPRLHNAVMASSRSPSPLKHAVCPECKSDIFQTADSSEFTCNRCDTVFQLDATGRPRVSRHRNSPYFWVGLVGAIALLILGRVSKSEKSPLLDASFFMCGVIVFSNVLLAAGRRGVMWTKYSAITFERNPMLFSAWMFLVLFLDLGFVALFVNATIALVRS